MTEDQAPSENTESTPPETSGGTPAEDNTTIPNLAANACPITPLLVAMIEYYEPVGLVSMRLRDAWIAPGASGPTVNFALAIGGQLRGGANGALWGRIRRHSLYITDADMGTDRSDSSVLVAMPNWGWVSMLVPNRCQRIVQKLIDGIPNLTHSPEKKLHDGMLVAAGRASPEIIKGAANNMTAEQIGAALEELAVQVEAIRGPGR